jgi:Flp pilus assembly protein TadB
MADEFRTQTMAALERREERHPPAPRAWAFLTAFTVVIAVGLVADSIATGHLIGVAIAVLLLIPVPMYFWRWRRDKARSAP